MKLPGVVLALLVGVILLLLFIIWSITRHRAPTLRIEAQGSLPELIRSLSGLSLGTPIAGNHGIRRCLSRGIRARGSAIARSSG